jgi:hypothetical protein
LKVLNSFKRIYRRSLRVGIATEILDLKENVDFSGQIDLTEKCLAKIDAVLKSHIKHNQSKIISKEELQLLCGQTSALDSLHLELSKVPEKNEILEEHLKVVKGKHSIDS